MKTQTQVKVKVLTVEDKKQFDSMRRKAQAVKVLSGQLDTFKDYQKQTFPDTEFHYGERKLASVKGQDGRPVFDLEGYLEAFPARSKDVARFTKVARVQVFRFH